MIVYRCAHCFRLLGDETTGVEVCPEHPDGAVQWEEVE